MMKFIRKLISDIFRLSSTTSLCPPYDQEKEYETKLWQTIQGQSYDFSVSANWKKIYYDTLVSEDEKNKVRSSLLKMLESTKYPMPRKTLIAYVCADLRMREAVQAVANLRNETSDSFKYAFTLTYEALSRGVSVPELERAVWMQAISECGGK
jgi:hypothetical protein